MKLNFSATRGRQFHFHFQVPDVTVDNRQLYVVGTAKIVFCLLCSYVFRFSRIIGSYSIFGEGSQISTNQKREGTVFSILIG